MAAQLFISYASPDQALAECVRDDLEAGGIVCWMAPRDVPGGGDYAKAIAEAIRSCPGFLLLLSASANASPHIEREVHLAAGGKTPILPVRIEAVEPQGALKYLLANTQWFDAFPRLEPRLAALRDEVQRLLARSNIVVPVDPRTRTRVHRVLAGAAAWLIVIGVAALLTAWAQRAWFNLLPWWMIPRVAPPMLLVIMAPVVTALAFQYGAHRNFSRIGSLDALFAIRGSAGARLRLGGAALVAVAIAGLLIGTPPSVSIALEPGSAGQYDAGFERPLSCRAGSYIVQQNSHFAVRTRVGRLNPPGRYTLRVEVAPYATEDGVEFCDVRLSEAFGVTQTKPRPDDAARSGYIEVEGTRERFVGERLVVFTATHYRGVQPSEDAWVRATLSLADGLRIDTDGNLPPSIFSTE